MRNYLKFLTTALVTALLLCTLCLSSFAVSTVFSDVDDSNEQLSEAVNLLSNLGVTNGKSATTFGTYDNVTREQMAAFIYRLLKPGKSIENVSNVSGFTDLEDPTYFGYVSWANSLGIIKGTSDTTFNPKGGITLQDAYTMVVRALEQEEEDFVYPYAYIDAAESTQLGLDEGIASTINYDTVLTRGDVAIILYNAFSAEMGITKTYQVERRIGNTNHWVLEKREYNPALCEEIYDIEIGEFVVRATPKYAFNDSSTDETYKPLVEGFSEDTLHVVAVENDEPLSEVYLPFAQTGLSGKADDYVMRTIKVYYTYEESGNAKSLDKIYFANGDYKVIDTNSVTINQIPKTDKSANAKYPKTSIYKAIGSVTANKEKIYFFDAPYDYLRPNYNVALRDTNDPTALEQAKYQLRNEKNAKIINIKAVDLEAGTYCYYIDEKQPANTAEDIAITLRRIFSKGAYKAKFFDVDGDGIYEYMHYMPATYGFMDGDDHKEFSSMMTENGPVRVPVTGSNLDLSFKPVIYYNGADITGPLFEDGDMVIAHLNPDANMIVVMGVVNPYKGYVANVRPAHCIIKVDGNSFQGAYSYGVVDNFFDGDQSIYDTYNHPDNAFIYSSQNSHSSPQNFAAINNDDRLAIGEIVEVYVAKVNNQQYWLYYDHLENEKLAFGRDDVLIPVADPIEDPELTSTVSQFNPTLGEQTYYAKAYMGDKTRLVPLNVFEMRPSLGSQYVGGEYNIGRVKSTIDPSENAYLDKLCKFTVDSDGLYTLVPLLHTLDEDGNYSGIERDSSVFDDKDGNKFFGNDLGLSVTGKIEKVIGNRYRLVNTLDGNTLLGEPFNPTTGKTLDYFTVTGATRIIIRNTTFDGSKMSNEYLEFDAENFAGTIATDLSNIQYILRTTPGSNSRADLLLLYAETVDFEFENKTDMSGWRIVASSEKELVEEGKYNNVYTLLNPFTGEVETGVVEDTDAKTKPSSVTAPANVGDIVELNKGKVNKDKLLGNLNLQDIGGGLVWITEYDESDNYIVTVPVEATENAITAGTIACEKCLVDFVESYNYNNELDFVVDKNGVQQNFVATAGAPMYYEITDDTKVTVLKYKSNSLAAFEKGEFALADVSAIASPKNENKCYNDAVEDKNGNFTNAYAKYLKAYVYVSKIPQANETPVADFIVIVATGEEDTVFSNDDTTFLPKTCAACK